MGYVEKLMNIGRIREAMVDEESKILFDAKVDYFITKNEEQFLKVTESLGKEWYCSELSDILRKINVKGIIIFGCGHDGKRSKEILENCGYLPIFFCDSDREKIGKAVDGIEVISVDKLVEWYRDYLVVLGSTKYMDEMNEILLEKNFPKENIFYPKFKKIYAECGKQYFDVFSVQDKEIFVDAGSYDGNSIMDFISWTNEKYEKVFAFEPIDEMFQLIRNRLINENILKVELFQSALWIRNEKLPFIENKSGSRVTDVRKATSFVEGVALDEIIKDEKITFIKMDIEGSELNALKGAKNIIIKNKPKLAICIYHKPEDILEIPAYILDLVKEYRFYIRHYSSCIWETVLYAEYIE